MEIKLTGIVGVSAVTPETHNAAQAPMIADGLASPVHQHLFCFRLDWELDGGNNSLYESEIDVMPLGENNPDGSQFCSVSRHLTDEHSAKRNIAPQTSRHWKVTNPEKLNGLGVPVAYKLLPAASPSLFARPESQVGRRGAYPLRRGRAKRSGAAYGDAPRRRWFTGIDQEQSRYQPL